MARISTYALDTSITTGDKWIGTDGPTLATKNFSVQKIIDFLNSSGYIDSIASKFFYQTLDPGEDRSNGSITFVPQLGPTVAFSSISGFRISQLEKSGVNISDLYSKYIGSKIIIQKASAPSQYGVYNWNSSTQNITETTFYDITLGFIDGNGDMEEDDDYLISLLQLGSATGVTQIFGSTFIDAVPTGADAYTLSLSATGTPSNLTGLRGDNSWGTLGLESLDEGNGAGWRLIGRDPAKYGNIGEGAIDFSNSTEATNENGSVGDNAITFGSNNINQSGQSIVTGSGVNLRKTNEFSASNIVTGESPLNIWGVTYNSIIAAWRSEVNVEGTSYDTNVVYQSLVVGDGLNFYSGRDSGVVGGGLISGSTGCFTVGVGNEDLTTTTSTYITNYYNNYGPRFIVGCGVYQPGGAVTTRQNGFVVMSDGTATFPILTDAKIDAAGDDSAVTKGWVTAQTSAADSNFVFYDVKNSSGSQILKGKGVMAVGTDGNSGHILINEFVADGSIEPKYFMGVLEGTLDNGEIGRVIHFGELRQFNTNGQNGETWNDGDVLWCDPANPGDFTLVEPLAPNVKIASAIVINASTNGKIKVRVQGNEGLHELHDVRIESQADGQLLVWDNTQGIWFNDGTATIDYTNGRVGIGTTSPLAKLHTKLGNSGVGSVDTGTSAIIESNTTNYLRFLSTDSSKAGLVWTTPGDNFAAYLRYGYSDQLLEIGTANSNDSISFSTGNASEKMRITDTGNVGIGTTSPAHILEIYEGESSVLQANSSYISINPTGSSSSPSLIFNADTGTGLYRPSSSTIAVSTDGSERLRIDSSGNVGIGTTSPGAKLEVVGDALANNHWSPSGSNAYYMNSNSTAGMYIDSTNFITLNAGGNEGIRIESTFGNVGIGNTNPTEKLDIDGNVKLGTTTGRQLMFGENKYGAVRLGNNLVVGGNSAVDIRTGNAAISSQSSRVFINQVGFVGVGTTSPQALLDVNGPIKIGDAVTSPLANTVGTMRYREDSNNSYVEMVMKTGASTYAWVVIQQNTW